MCELIFIEQDHCQQPGSLLSSRIRGLQLLSMRTFLPMISCCGAHCGGCVLNYRCTTQRHMFRSIYHEEIFMHLDALSSRYMGLIYGNSQGFTCWGQIYTLNDPFIDIHPYSVLPDAIIKGVTHRRPKEISSDRLWHVVQQCMAYEPRAASQCSSS